MQKDYPLMRGAHPLLFLAMLNIVVIVISRILACSQDFVRFVKSLVVNCFNFKIISFSW